MTIDNQIFASIDAAITKRKRLIKAPYLNAFRLINGFLENVPHLVVEVFGKTIVFHDYSKNSDSALPLIPFFQEHLPWLSTGIIKKRRSKLPKDQAGSIVFGDELDSKIIENGLWYYVDLLMNQDASFYLDTRELRSWIYSNMKDKRVLNTFAYTGSLGIAALAGGASDVVQLDLNRRFLSVAMRSASLNNLPQNDKMYQTADFWPRINHFKTINNMFDCVILDPPVYSKTAKATIDITKNYHKLINKVRPLILDGGTLITINNALFQSGEDHQNVLKDLCKDGYLTIENIIPVPEDCIGGETTPKESLPSDPSPYNHSTKITILRVRKK